MPQTTDNDLRGLPKDTKWSDQQEREDYFSIFGMTEDEEFDLVEEVNINTIGNSIDKTILT